MRRVCVLFQFIQFLTAPKLKDKDRARREYILNVLLLGSFWLGLVAAFVNRYFAIVEGKAYDGLPPNIVFAIALIFLALYFFSRAGKSRLIAYIFIYLCLFPAVYTSYRWGADVPQALLIYALVIVMAGVLIGTKFAFAITAFISTVLFILTYLQTKGIVLVSSLWKDELLHFGDFGISVATFGVITIVSWLFNREMEGALRRARGSEKALKKERDMLEARVEERTKELKKAQLEKVLHLYRLADFGRITAGLFHDLVNPLTMVSLNLERLQAQDLEVKKRGVNNTKKLMGRAVSGTKRMEGFVKATRKQIQKQETKTFFCLNDEIAQVMEVVEHRSKELRVKINLVFTKKRLKTYGNPLRFNQLVSNLVCNAIDSYETVRRRKNREVIVKLFSPTISYQKKERRKAVLVVQDLGCGIAKRNLEKIFDPFFTTKSVEKGTGIGLSICKDVVEKEFKGKIIVESKKGEGTTLIVNFPLKRSPLRKKKVF